MPAGKTDPVEAVSTLVSFVVEDEAMVDRVQKFLLNLSYSLVETFIMKSSLCWKMSIARKFCGLHDTERRYGSSAD